MLKALVVCLFCLTVGCCAQNVGLSLTATPEFEFVPIAEQTVFLVVSFEAPSSAAVSDRSPVSLTAVLDRSGSMEGSKIDLLKRSTEFLVDRLEDGDFIGVVSYSSDVTSDVPLSPISAATKSGINEAIDSIFASGSTNLAGGLFQGIDQQVDADVSGTVVKSVILFTDGLANVGVTDIGQITSTMTNSLTGVRPPTVYALGFGGDHDAAFLQAIAEAGRGSYVFVANENAIAGAIGQILGGLLTVTAQDIVVEFEPLSGARIVSIRGGAVNGALTRTTFPDLFAEERRDILIEMRVPVLDDALEDQEILRVTMRYFNTITEETEVRTTTVVISRSLDLVDSAPASIVETTRLRFKVADDIDTAVAQREAGDAEGASETLDGTLTAIEESPESDSPEAQALAADVTATKADVESDDFDESDANRAAAGAEGVSAQRSTGSGFASSTATPTQSIFASDAEAFVGN